MNSGLVSANESDESDIAEKSPRGRYIRYNEELGRGPNKVVVYKGFDEFDGSEVIWTKLSLDCDIFELEDCVDRLNKLLKPLKHDNIIKYYSSWVDNVGKNINIISESFTSGSLRQYRKKHRGVDIVAIKNWARQILQGLCYLHSHDPPIVHGDLTCENLFVNGNTGEVKIGDIGLASFVGSPEFNAPEVFEEEEYNKLVDLHSFGICMLELITSQCPYSDEGEKTQKHIKTQAISGLMSVLLAKVKDLEVKKFIEKCLLPTTTGLSAVELLKDPFFEMPIIAMTINETAPLVSVMEFGASNGKREFRLRGERTDENSISLMLHIADLCGQATKIEFVFYLKSDTTLSIAGEMAEHLDLPNEDVNLIADLMDSLIIKMVPCWIPSFVKFSAINCTYGDPILAF